MKNKWNLLFAIIILGLAACKKDKCEEKSKDPNYSCSLVYDPVCGCNHVTYANDCVANCYGITEYTRGTCK